MLLVVIKLGDFYFSGYNCVYDYHLTVQQLPPSERTDQRERLCKVYSLLLINEQPGQEEVHQENTEEIRQRTLRLSRSHGIPYYNDNNNIVASTRDDPVPNSGWSSLTTFYQTLSDHATHRVVSLLKTCGRLLNCLNPLVMWRWHWACTWLQGHPSLLVCIMNNRHTCIYDSCKLLNFN